MGKKLILATLGLVLSSVPVNADWRYFQTVQNVQFDHRPCAFFTLVGVSVADSALPDAGPWFAIPKTAGNYNEMVSALLTSKGSGARLQVSTAGTISCDHATVAGIGLN